MKELVQMCICHYETLAMCSCTADCCANLWAYLPQSPSFTPAVRPAAAAAAAAGNPQASA
eukprot:245216-Pelagomonas_calceolata.AAC.8